MWDAHLKGHGGRDVTCAKFRHQYWTTSAPKLAKAVKNGCQACKLRDAELMQQVMGALPEARLKPAPPFTHCMVDLFGPYHVRGEVQKRVTLKVWGVAFSCLYCRALHIECMCDYNASSFLLALTRFASVRGWSAEMYCDPGSQIVAVSKEMNQAAEKAGLLNGMRWVVGPAESPWHQGAVESMVKAAKHAIHMAIHNVRLSMPEILTVFSEVANTINERPIGRLPGVDSAINVLTPNCLLLGFI